MLRLIAFLLAITVALLYNDSRPPVATMANQLMAMFGWGMVLLLAPAVAPDRRTLRTAVPLLVAFGLLFAGCALSIANGWQPRSPGFAVLGVLALAGAVALHGATAGATDAIAYFRAFALAVLAQALCGACIAIVQVFLPRLSDNIFIAFSMIPGRAGGNLGQANHFADTMLWGLIAMVSLARSWFDAPVRPRHAAPVRVLWALGALLLVLGVVLTGSRSGLVSLGLLAAWGVFDRKLPSPLRAALLVSPLVAIAILPGVASWEHGHGVATVLSDRGQGGVTAYRGEIWANAITLIKMHPWVGAGWGEFNFAWALTPFTTRGAGLVDNAHNLPLHLAVELGLPAAILIMALLLWAFGAALLRAWRVTGQKGADVRCALMIVVVAGVHSMLEYPMWYAYLLLPTAWAFGMSMGGGGAAQAPGTMPATGVEPSGALASSAPPLRAWRVFGVLMVVLAASAWMDYLNVVRVFLPSQESLPDRVHGAQRSPLFSYLADFVDVGITKLTPALVDRTSHVIISGHLFMAWSQMLYDQGQVDKARYLAARLREFKLEGPAFWYVPCDDPKVVDKPFQCLPPGRPLTWSDFR